jgi:hypothetical protein
MKPTSRVAILGSLILAAVPCTSAAEGEKREKAKAIGTRLNAKRVTFEFQETPVRDAARMLGSLAEVQVVVDPAVRADRTVTLRVRDMPAWSALRWLARAANVEAKLKDGAVHLTVGEKKAKPLKHARAVRMARSRPVGKATVELGSLGSIELTLSEDDLPEETRALLRTLLRRAIERHARKLAAEIRDK